jgi:hypothetical protein
VSLQLTHEISPVQLHGAFLGAEEPSDLLIQQPLRYQLEHLSLSGREQVEPTAQLVSFGPLPAQLSAAPQGTIHRKKELLVVEGLEEKVSRPCLHAYYAGVEVDKSGHQDDRQSPVRNIHCALHVEPGEFRHPDIENEAAGTIGVREFQESRSGWERPDGMAGGPEESLEATPERIVIVHHKNQRVGVRHVTNRWGKGNVQNAPVASLAEEASSCHN